MSKTSVDEAYREKAFQLAWFLHRRRTLALKITVEACTRLNVAVRSQRRRAYYRPITAGRGARRYRVSMTSGQLLQRLVYCVSEPHERRQELAGEVTDEDLVVRFIAFLVRISTRRNAFHVNLAVTRLLHGYSAEEALSLYETVAQDPDRLFDGSYLRARKRLLLGELQNRFKGRVESTRGPLGEHRLRHRAATDPVRDLVQRSLQALTPWETKCPLPKDLAPRLREISALRFWQGRADAEHAVEMRRIHVLLHPTCFNRLVESLGLPAPQERLTVPIFAAANDQDGAAGNRREPVTLSPEEQRLLESELRRHEELRQAGAIGTLFVRADGEVLWRRCGHSRGPDTIDIPAATELLEVGSEHPGGSGHEEVLLACCVLDHDSNERQEFRIALAAAESLWLTVHPADRPQENLRVTLESASGFSMVNHPAWRLILQALGPFRSPITLAVATACCIAIGLWLLPSPDLYDELGPVRGVESVAVGELKHVHVDLDEPLRSSVILALRAEGSIQLTSREEAGAELRLVAGEIQLVARNGDLLWQSAVWSADSAEDIAAAVARVVGSSRR